VQYLFIALEAILPSFLIIGMGCIARNVKWISEEDVRHFNRASYWMFAPIMVFNSIYTADLSSDASSKLLLFCFFSIIATWLVALALTPKIEKDPGSRGIFQLSLYFSNIMLLGIPMMSHMYGEESIGKMGIAMSLIVPMFNGLASITLEIFRGGKINVGKILRGIVTNPLIIGCASGLVFNHFSIPLPMPVARAVANVGSTATVLMLFLLGCYFNLERSALQIKSLVCSVLCRLVIFPSVIIGIATALGFCGPDLLVILIAFASPCGVSVFSMANRFQGNLSMASQIIIASTTLSCITLSLWLSVLLYAGLM